MSTNFTVSSDIDTFLRKSTKEEAATFLGLEDTKAQWGQITGTLANQSDLVAELALKGSASDVAINTAKVGITSAQAQAITDNTAKTGITSGQASAIVANTAKVGITSSQSSAITANTANIAGKQDTLTFGIANTNAVKMDNTSGTPNGGDVAIFASTGIMPKTVQSLKSDLGIDLKAPIASPDFTGTVGIAKSGVNGVLDIDGDVWQEGGKIYGETGSLDLQNNIAQLILGTFKSDAIKVERVDANSTLIFGVDASSATAGKATMLNAEVSNDLTVSGDADVTGNLEVDGTTTFKDHITVNNGDITVSNPSGTGTGGNVIAKDVTANNKLHVKEIQSLGSTGATTQPIVYDAKEHRFRDFDASPTDLMVIEKIDGYTGGRVGINKDPSASNAVALHVVAGKNNSTNVKDLALKVIGGAFFDDFVRVGHYATAPVDANNDPTLPVGSIILNTTSNTFQGNVGSANGGWKTFTMS